MYVLFFGFLKNNLLNGWSVTADLPGLQYQLPAVLDTSLRPDIAVWCNSSRMLKIFELTVCFENIFSSSNLKRKKYQGLVRMANTKGWKAEVHPLQTGSRGLVDNQSFQPMSDITDTSPKDLRLLRRPVWCCSLSSLFPR